MPGRLLALVVLALEFSLPVHAVDGAAIFENTAGIWRIASQGTLNRWIVIHNLAEAERTGLFHIEVIGREQGKPVWAIEHLCNHMAITLDALKRSVIRPLKSGAVYPESFATGLEEWNKTPQAERPICDRSVVDCLPSAR
jgi:hypothetical protein